MTLTVLVLTLVFVGLLVFGVPIKFAMLGAAAAALAVDAGSIPWTLIVNRTVMGVDSFVLLAIPLFILAGMLMDAAGLSERLMALAKQGTRKLPGGLPMSVVIASMLNSGLTGSVVGDMATMTAIAHPGMVANGYQRQYGLAVIASASAFGILIPPSIIMIVIGTIAQVPVTTLFVASLAPAVVLGLMVLALIGFQALTVPALRMRMSEAESKGRLLGALRDSAWAAGVPIIIFGGIIVGIATATEIAAFAVLYTLFVGFAVYRRITLRQMWKITVDAAVATGMVTIILGLANIFAYILATQGVPRAIADFVTSSGMSPWLFMFTCALVFVFIGSAVDGIASLLIFIPVFLPVAAVLEINVIHYLVTMILASGIGLLLPPAGMGMIMGCAIGKVPMDEVFRPYAPFLATLVGGVVVLIFVPQIVLAVPQYLGLAGV